MLSFPVRLSCLGIVFEEGRFLLRGVGYDTAAGLMDKQAWGRLWGVLEQIWS